MPRLKVLSKEEWGGQPTQMDVEGEIIEKVEIPAKYVIISATCTRPCVALEDCAILMKAYQGYFIYNNFPDVPFNFLAGPGGVALEGRGWHTNCLDFQEEDEVEEPVWNNISEIKGYASKAENIKTLKKLVGIKKTPTISQTKKRILSKIEHKKVLESRGEVIENDQNKHFGKSIVIGLITDVFVERNVSTRALSTAFSLIKHGIRSKYIDKKYRLRFNFDPLYKVHKFPEFNTPNVGIIDPREAFKRSMLEDFLDHFMIPSMNPERN